MEKVLQIENHILTVTDILVHAYAVTLQDVPSVKLVPQDTIVKIRRRKHHLIGILLARQRPAGLNGSFFRHIPIYDVARQRPAGLNGPFFRHISIYNPIKVTDYELR